MRDSKRQGAWAAILVLFLFAFAFTMGCGGDDDDDDDDDSGDDDSGPSTFVLPDTGQTDCYDDNNTIIECPPVGADFHGQDAQYTFNAPSYTDNGDGTVTDNVTGLIWTQAYYGKMGWEDALDSAGDFALAGYDDWRIPTIKELYSLIDFSGATGMGDFSEEAPDDAIPYIDTDVFDFVYGDPADGDRYIDAQYWSSNEYVSTTMDGQATTFGVNFADGRIKGYGRSGGGVEKTEFVRYVRGTSYGVNKFTDNGDDTVTDSATGLTWMRVDSGSLGAGDGGTMDWPDALAYCEDLDFAGRDDWRLPNAKELQGILDYTRSPDTTNSPAIDPVFDSTSIINEAGDTDWAFYWTSTTHDDGPDFAAYVAFGRALGCMSFGGGDPEPIDVHGAGAQRSDPKTAEGTSLGCGDGPQGDVIRVYNMVRCVRGNT